MLKNIPACISPDLMHALMSMGHGDEIVLADKDFPASACARMLVRADGVNIPMLLDAILRFFPLDTYADLPVAIMDASEWRKDAPPYYEEYRAIIRQHESGFKEFERVSRYNFYNRAKNAFVIIATSQPEGNLILKKGCIEN